MSATDNKYIIKHCVSKIGYYVLYVYKNNLIFMYCHLYIQDNNNIY